MAIAIFLIALVIVIALVYSMFSRRPAISGSLGATRATPGRKPRRFAAPRLANGTLGGLMDGVTTAFWWSVMSAGVLFVFSLGCALGTNYEESVFTALLQWWPLMLATGGVWVVAGVYNSGDRGISVVVAYVSTAAWLAFGLLSGIDWAEHLSWPQLQVFHDLVQIFPWNDQVNTFVVYLMKASFSWPQALRVITGAVYFLVVLVFSIAKMPTSNGAKIPWFLVIGGLGTVIFSAIWL